MEVRNARVAVTGGAGFIGSHLVDRLLAADNRVLVIDDFSTGKEAHLGQHSHEPGLHIECADIRDEARMDQLLRGVDFVFHLATRNVRLSLVQPTLIHEVNTAGAFNVLKAAATNGVCRFLYCSSSEVNGTAHTVPLPEEYHYRPETIYGASKLAGEYYTQVFHRSGWLPTVIARPHNTYGPREHYEGNKGEVIPRFILWALAGKPLLIHGTGNQTRDFTYVSDTADNLARLMESDQAVGGTFNICRGEEIAIVELARLILEITGSKSSLEFLPGRPSDVLRLFGDPSRLRGVLGSSPAISIRTGLEKTIAWFREHLPLNARTLAALAINTWQQDAPEPWLAKAHGRLKVVEGEVPQRASA
jgi:UDP-glucose 4-epimerase